MSKVTRKVTSGALQITPSFYLEQFIEDPTAARLGLNNSPDPFAVQNIHRLAKVLEVVQVVLKKPISIKGAFQCVDLNAHHGDTPDHLRGEAADITAPTFGNPIQVFEALQTAAIKGITSLRIEHSWVHIGVEA